MTGDREQDIRRVRDQQTVLYGAPLGDLIARLAEDYGLSRGRLASILGLSAPMLSQLASGRRIKIGNPSAVQRMQRLLEVAPDVRAGRIAAADAVARIESERPGSVLTRATDRLPRQGALDVQLVLRWASSAEDLGRAAELLSADFPALAEVLRVYGTGSAADAEAHFEQVRPR
ncbi:helix-turn-helix domain-containing protein [Nocardioides sp. GXZ039]|uniref:helix-turn-helix domain-containing protein n=1 Tax=Nocardioides sp. GXZ039 TaxID=3136018 RepID=UPI0030F426B5